MSDPILKKEAVSWAKEQGFLVDEETGEILEF